MLGVLLTALLFAPSATALDDAVDEAIVRFVDAVDDRDELARSTALGELVLVAHVDAAAPIVAEFARAREDLEKDRRELRDLSYRLERRELLLAGARARAERAGKSSLGVDSEETEVVAMRDDVRRLEGRVGSAEPWCAELRAGLVELSAALPEHKARKIPKTLLKDVDDHPQLGVRLASLDLLGELGADGTASDIVKRMAKWAQAIERSERDLPKLMQEVFEVEEQLQKDIQGKRKDLLLFYRNAKKAANETRQVAQDAERLIETGIESAAGAFVREGEKEQRKTLSGLMRGLRTEKGRHRLEILGILRVARIESVRAALRESLATADEPLLVASSVEALLALEDPDTLEELRTRWFQSEHELVRARAYAGAAELADVRAIGPLIDRLEVEEGRLRTDVNQALEALTGRDFHGNFELWRRFWDEHEEGFEVPVEPTEHEAAGQSVGLTFFGIRTESQRVLFVLDVSGSMAFSTDPRVDGRNPRDRENYPKDGEVDRMTVAKGDLAKALSGLEDGGLFNLVLYASDVWSWQDEFVEMEPESRAEVLEFVQSLEPGGGTNIYGALWIAFELAGVETSATGEWAEPTIDTIYFLSDGQASLGLTTETDEILEFVRDRNRTAGIVFHTIGLGGGHDPVLLRRLAEENGGIYVGR